ncbi:hypothetical protein BGV22_20405, partial [Clostridioides difficile]
DCAGGLRSPDLLGVKGAWEGRKVRSERLRLNVRNLLQRGDLRAGGESGNPRVAVKCVEIRRNTSCEGGSLDCN